MLSRKPPRSYVSKFVITEEGAWFVPLDKRSGDPRSIEVISRIFDLDAPEVLDKLVEDLLSGRVVVGTHNPFTGEVSITSTTDLAPYISKRTGEVFGGEGGRV